MLKRTSIRNKLLGFSIAFFLLTLVTGSVAFIFSMQDIINSGKAQELQQTIELKKMKLESSVLAEIAIAIKMAGSPLIQRYFASPGDNELEKIAFEEIAGYRRAFAGNTVFWVNDTDKKFYSDDAYSYTVNTEDPANYWYKMTLYETKKFNFNINYNPELKKIMLWINAPVFDSKNNNKPIGMLGTGIDLTTFTESVYQSYSGDADLYLFNSAGEITGARDLNLVSNKALIGKVLDKTGAEILNRAKELSHDSVQTFIIPGGVIAVSTIPSIGWYIVMVQPLSMNDYLNSNMTLVFSVMMVVIALIFIVFNVFIHALFKPLRRIVITLKKISDNWDMTQKIPEQSKDEIGDIASSFNVLIEAFRVSIAEAQSVTDTLASASGELSTVSDQLSASSENTVRQSNAVATTTEQMAVNINAMAGGAEQASENANEVAGAAEQMSANMNTIAAAIEEMSSSISQIANNTGEVRQIASQATGKASGATNAMNKLGAAAKEIGQVTDVIKKIADKTNLLALNATIEAASAGEAGKGFAVVAGEIKELANQSAASADDISRRIEDIQSGTSNAVNVINDVSDIIEKINKSVEDIAGHVSQQNKASNEIANNVTQANTSAKKVANAISEVAKSANHVSQNASDAAKGAGDVSQNILNMSGTAKTSAQGASRVNQSARELQKMSLNLKDAIVKFKI